MKENLLKMILAVAALAMALETTWAHGFAGKRFFPATLTTDDPFVADEMSLPTFSTIVAPENGGTRNGVLSGHREIHYALARRRNRHHAG